MLKVFGASFSELSGYILNEYVTLTILASVLGVLFSLIVSYGFSHFVFGGAFAVNIPILFITIALITVISTIVCLLASFKVFKARPSDVLRAS
jgi:ABC-type antimicrobial peptide transport system permease subunit